MKKQISIQSTELGQKYFFIYEVRAKKLDGEIITDERFFNKKEAEEHIKFIYDNYSSLYSSAWVREQFVWC